MGHPYLRRELAVLLALIALACDGGEIGSAGLGDHADGGAAPAAGPEICDGLDNDGDGVVDEGCACKSGSSAECYPGPAALAGVGLCAKGTHTCQGDSEFGTWGACTGAVLPVVEICGNGIDEDCDGKDLACGAPPDAGAPPACATGQTQPCYSGPPGTAGKGLCKAGTQSCLAGGSWGPCAGEVTPKPEVCNNWIDEDCNGQDQLCPGTAPLPLNINGDCVTASCPPNAPHPVGCNITFDGGDDRGCVAHAPGSPSVYFQEGDACLQGHLAGTLLCSSTPGPPLSAVSCPINKATKLYPSDKSGCPPTWF